MIFENKQLQEDEENNISDSTVGEHPYFKRQDPPLMSIMQSSTIILSGIYL